MDNAYIYLGDVTGRIGPMHAVNNGPAHRLGAIDQKESNLALFREAGIPCVRTHDAAFYSTYGGEHCVDIGAIFPNFDADPYDPASYDFQLTDEYLQVIQMAGAKVLYRLGSKIEHWSKKYGTLPPRDFHKWAVICEHIIRHYNEGWANGFSMGIEYWEIWNEPDLDPDDSRNKRCWGGTAAEFYDLFDIAVTHLKGCFPHLKIGGPAVCGLSDQWLDGLFSQLHTPIDFFSWHQYARDPETLKALTRRVRRILDAHGLEKTESILNEWNYVTSFEDEDQWKYSRKMEKGLKGASFAAAVMCDQLYEPLDMLMYYDARPCGMNGLFDTDFPSEALKGYYPFVMFNELYKLGFAVKVESECGKIHLCAAKDETGFAAMITHFDDDDAAPGRRVALKLEGACADVKRVRVYLLDQGHDMTLTREELVSAPDFTLYLDLPLHTTCLIRGDRA